MIVDEKKFEKCVARLPQKKDCFVEFKNRSFFLFYSYY